MSVRTTHATRIDRTIFSQAMDLLRDLVWLLWIFARLNWSQDFVLFRKLHEDFGGSSSWNILPNCQAYSTLTENFSQFWFRLLAWLVISLLVPQSTLLPNSGHDEVVQLAFRYSEHCGWDGLRVTSFFSRTIPPIFSFQRFTGKGGHSLRLVLSLAICQRSHILSQHCNMRLLDRLCDSLNTLLL